MITFRDDIKIYQVIRDPIRHHFKNDIYVLVHNGRAFFTVSRLVQLSYIIFRHMKVLSCREKGDPKFRRSGFQVFFSMAMPVLLQLADQLLFFSLFSAQALYCLESKSRLLLSNMIWRPCPSMGTELS